MQPDLSVSQLASVNLSLPQGLELARRGIWQHLLAGSVAPNVAKVALDLAESIFRNSKPKDDPAKSSTAQVIAQVMGTKPPQQDE